MKETLDTFYFVWNPQGSIPNRKHEMLESAKAEAERIARKTGQRIIILKSVCDVVVSDVHWTKHKKSDDPSYTITMNMDGSWNET